jgi:hypothetical protein
MNGGGEGGGQRRQGHGVEEAMQDRPSHTPHTTHSGQWTPHGAQRRPSAKPSPQTRPQGRRPRWGGWPTLTAPTEGKEGCGPGQGSCPPCGSQGPHQPTSSHSDGWRETASPRCEQSWSNKQIGGGVEGDWGCDEGGGGPRSLAPHLGPHPQPTHKTFSAHTHTYIYIHMHAHTKHAHTKHAHTRPTCPTPW